MPTNNLFKNSASPSAEEKTNWREDVLNGLLQGIFFLGILAALFASNDVLRDTAIPQRLKFNYISIYIGAVVFLGIITFIRRIPYVIRASILLLLFYVLALAGLIGAGLSGDGRIFILAIVVIASILLNTRISVVTLVLGTATLALIALLFNSGLIYVPTERLANSTSLSSWVSGSLVLVFLAVSIIIPVRYLISNFEAQIAQTSTLLHSVEIQQEALEELVDERTQALEHRASQLTAIAQVAHDALTFQDVDDLLKNTAILLSENFNYYHAGIFLLDEKKEYAILKAASSDGGQKMLARGHQLRVGSEGIVGATAAEKRPHIALDVGEDAIYFNNPDLPETHSEMALPLLAQNHVVGVLDIQSTEIQAFGQQDIEIFQTLANQIALAIQNAKLIGAAQENISKLEALTGKQAELGWKSHLENQSHAFLYTPLSIKNAQKETHFKVEENDEHTRIPILLRDREIGKIALKRKLQKWSPKERNLVAEVANQVGLAIENARLVDETREQGNRDQLITEFSTKLRETLDMDTVVKTAIEELQKTFALREVEVRLNTAKEK